MEDNKTRIFVTKPALPDLEEFIPYLEQIWSNRILTNNGPFHRQLEEKLSEFLGVPYISLFANGTLALVTALQSLHISGEVITSPYSFVATTHSLWWNNIKPVFVDIEASGCNLDPEKIESAITPATTAILPIHVYGIPCDVERIEEIAHRHKLKVIYDAAHAFGVNYKGDSVLNHGDLSVLSFHATKAFNTMEGGAIVCHDKETKQTIDYLKNFGFANETEIAVPGINSKMNEMQAALGLIQLNHHHRNIEKRKAISLQYRKELDHQKGLSFCDPREGTGNYNYSYFPVFIDHEKYGRTRDELYFHLKENEIYGRRYFYPLISNFPSYSSLPSSSPENLIHATQTSNRVICLPIYPDLSSHDVERISEIIRNYAV